MIIFNFSFPFSIDRINRGQIFNDLFNLAKAGHVSYDLAMDSTKYLFNENDYIPWKSGLISLGYLRLMLRRSAGYGMFKKYLEGEMLQTYRSLGFNTKKSDSIDDIDLRTNIIKWMCNLGYEDCQKQSVDLFQQWMDVLNSDLFNPIDPGIRSTVYCKVN